MELRFSKMHGCGNDFVVFDATKKPLELSQAQAAFIADRHLGVGCDQILIVESSDNPDADYRYRILNSDGGEVSQCGNGARCFVRFVHNKGLSNKNPLEVETASGKLTLHAINDSDEVRVNMGEPRFAPHQIPIASEQTKPLYEISVADQKVEFSCVSMGNPHAIIMVDDVMAAPVNELGPLIESHPFFPQRVNVGFMQIKAPDRIALRVFERGVGETRACGSGACAAVVAGHRLGLIDRSTIVELPGGQLHIDWQADSNSVLMTGPATHVYDGCITLPNPVLV